jgi:hypothetical protein
MPQAELQCVAHLVIHASSTHSGSAWVMNNQMSYTLRFSLSHEWPNEVHTQVQLGSWITKWATHSGSAWVMNNWLFITRPEPDVCSSFGYSWLKMNLSVYLIWLFMTQAEPECVPHLVIHDSSWTWVCSSFGYSWLKLNLSEMSYTLRFSLSHE